MTSHLRSVFEDLNCAYQEFYNKFLAYLWPSSHFLNLEIQGYVVLFVSAGKKDQETGSENRGLHSAVVKTPLTWPCMLQLINIIHIVWSIIWHGLYLCCVKYIWLGVCEIEFGCEFVLILGTWLRPCLEQLIRFIVLHKPAYKKRLFTLCHLRL